MTSNNHVFRSNTIPTEHEQVHVLRQERMCYRTIVYCTVLILVSKKQGGHFPDHVKFSDFSLTFQVAWTGKDYRYTA